MYEISKSHSLVSNEAAKMEMATSIVMLSSGAVTTFWLMFHMFFDTDAMRRIQQELHAITKYESKSKNAILRKRVPHLSAIREGCPTLVAMLNESLRYHSTVINIKQVKHDTTLDDQYLLVKQAIVMIPGQSIHHNTDIWGATATTFDHMRFLSAHSKKNLSSTSAFRPFSAGVTMCPGRHFSTTVIMCLVAMVLLQYDVLPLEGTWVAPTKCNADLWNAMSKPDWEVNVKLMKRVEEKKVEWKFVWGDDAAVGQP
jgi:cytochrome P450